MISVAYGGKVSTAWNTNQHLLKSTCLLKSNSKLCQKNLEEKGLCTFISPLFLLLMKDSFLEFLTVKKMAKQQVFHQNFKDKTPFGHSGISVQVLAHYYHSS